MRPTQPPQLGFYVYFLAFMAVIGGFFFGYDTGIVSGAMLYLPDYDGMKPLTSMWKQLIVSITPGMAIVGSLAAGPASDHFGRKKLILASSFSLTVGGIVSCVATEKICLLVGRIFVGIAIGFASMIGPAYVGEASPAHIRGTLATGYQLMVTFGLLMSNVVAACFSYINPTKVGWRLMLGCAAVPSAIQFFGFLFLPESPRYLFGKGFHAETESVLQKIYANDEKWIRYELDEIEKADDEEKRAKASVGDKPVIIRMLQTPHVRKALVIGCCLQLCQQFAAINTIVYYASHIITAAGIDNNHTTLWISTGIAVVNFLATIIPAAFVEKFGRRILLLISVAGVDLTLILMAISFLLINRDSAKTISFGSAAGFSSISHFTNCQTYSNCDFCVTDENCGFCHTGDERTPGVCIPTDSDNTDFSTIGNCTAGYDTSIFGWENEFCKTKYTVMPIIVMVVYLAFFEMGFAPLAFVLNAEFYPLWARSTGCALSVASNWVGNVIISLTFLTLSQGATKYGAFFIYAAITAVAFVIFFFFIPETKGLPIEQVEMLFMNSKDRKMAELALREKELEAMEKEVENDR